MLPQYKMVLVNVILSSFLLLGLIIFKYILKRKVNLFYLLLLISILPIVSIFRTGTYESGDLSLHAERLISFYNSFANFHLIPRWTPEFNAGYGEPHFLFAYFLPYFIGSIFHFIGFSFLDSIKLLLAISFVFSGLTMYFWVKDELGEKAGFVSAIFYLFMPYHLVDMHFRVTIAENLSFVFLPLILLSVKKLLEKGAKTWFVILSGSLALLILSHQAITLMFLPIIMIYCLFSWFRKKNIEISRLIYCFASILFGFLISAFYWLPVISLARFTQHALNLPPVLFPNPIFLLYSPWRLGFLFQGHKGELSYLIGYTQILVLCFAIYLLIFSKLSRTLRNLLILFLATSAVLIIMMLPLTKQIWETAPLLKYSQFSTRLLVPLSLCISVISGIVAKKINKAWFIFALCFSTITYTILNWGNRGTISYIDDRYLIKEFASHPDISGLEPTSPIWADLNKSKLRTKPKSSIEILKGNAVIKAKSRTPIFHSYTINSFTSVEIKENTLFFPGWTIMADNQLIPINYKNSKAPGVITFNLGKGTHNVNVEFLDLPVITFSKWLSGASFFGMLIYIFFPKKLHLPKS